MRAIDGIHHSPQCPQNVLQRPWRGFYCQGGTLGLGVYKYSFYIFESAASRLAAFHVRSNIHPRTQRDFRLMSREHSESDMPLFLANFFTLAPSILRSPVKILMSGVQKRSRNRLALGCVEQKPRSLARLPHARVRAIEGGKLNFLANSAIVFVFTMSPVLVMNEYIE